MGKKFNLKIKNQKKLQNLARVESIYNINYVELNINGKEKEIAVPNYNYKIGEMDGKDMRSIFERWKDKNVQEKRYGGK